MERETFFMKQENNNIEDFTQINEWLKGKKTEVSNIKKTTYLPHNRPDVFEIQKQFELSAEKISLGTLLKFQHDSINAVITAPVLKHKYIRFEIKNESNLTANKIIGVYIAIDQNDKHKERKENVLVISTPADNPIVNYLLPALNAVAYTNLNLYLLSPEEYFKK